LLFILLEVRVRLRTRSVAALAVTAAGIATALLPAGAASAESSPSSAGDIVYTAHPPKAKAALPAARITPSLRPQDCLAATKGAVACQDPASIRAAYDIPEAVHGQPAGTGQTIVIVDAFGSPTA
jgi:hypothetical protein